MATIVEAIECRKIMFSEVKEVCNLYLRIEHRELNNKERMIYYRSAEQVYQKMLAHGSYTYGAFDKTTQKLLGVINVNKIFDYYIGYELAPYIHLETFIVDEAYQNQGIGTRLLQSVVNKVKEEGCTYIILQSNNPYVQKIADKVGLSEHLMDMRVDFINHSL